MDFDQQIDAQLQALLHTQNDLLRWRPTLMRSVLDMVRPSRVMASIRSIDPDAFPVKTKKSSSTKKNNVKRRSGGNTAAITAVRRMLKKTRVQMGIPAELPVSPSEKTTNGLSGKPTDEQLERFRVEHCIPWMVKNAGYPRREQLIDPAWDLHPYPPTPVSPISEPVEVERREGAESRSRKRAVGQSPNAQDAVTDNMRTAQSRAAKPSKNSGHPSPINEAAAREAAEWEQLAAETKARGSGGTPNHVDDQRLSEFCGPAVPQAGATEDVKKQYLEDKRAALAQYIQSVISQGYELLEPYTGNGLPKVRRSSEIH